MSLRVYVRIEKATDLPEDLRGSECHMKLVLGQVIMRTKTRAVDHIHRHIVFADIATGRSNELFVFGVKSMEQLASTKLRIQLRKDRFFLRSQRIGEASIPLAVLDISRSLMASFPLRGGSSVNADSGDSEIIPGAGTKAFGCVLVRVEIEADAVPAPLVVPQPKEPNNTTSTPLPTSSNSTEELNNSPDPNSGPTTAPKSFLMMNTSGHPASKAQTTMRLRTHGTQTDRLFMTEDDVHGLSEGMPPYRRSEETSTNMSTIMRLDPPPSQDVFAPRQSLLPVDVLARQRTAAAHPNDDVEGLMLYCEQTQRYQRELETTLAKHHLDTTRSRLKAIQSIQTRKQMRNAASTSSAQETKRRVDDAEPMSENLVTSSELERLVAIL